MANNQCDFRASTQEVLKPANHFLMLGQPDLAANVVGPLDQNFSLARVFTDGCQQRERLLIVTAPQASTQGLDRLRCGVAVKIHQPGLMHVFLADGGMRLAVPLVLRK